MPQGTSIHRIYKLSYKNCSSDFFFVLSTSILIVKVILNKENTIEVIKNIKGIRVLGRYNYCYFSY